MLLALHILQQSYDNAWEQVIGDSQSFEEGENFLRGCWATPSKVGDLA